MDKIISKISQLPPRAGLALSYVICINTCAFIRNLFKVILWYGFRNYYFSEWLGDFFTLVSFFIMLGCGGIMSYLVHKNSVFHASLAVALGVAFSYFLSGVSIIEYSYFIRNVMAGFVLGGIGGAVVLLIRKLRSN